MRIGIDCDGVLRDLIPCIIDDIKETHPQHADKIKVPNSWNWSDWLPFWTEEEAEQYIFEDNYLDFFFLLCFDYNHLFSIHVLLCLWLFVQEYYV